MSDLTPLQKHRAEIERRDRVCQLLTLIPGHVCGGPLQAAHIPPKQWVKRRWETFWDAHRCDLTPEQRRCRITPLAVLFSDRDLGLLMCERGHRAWDERGVRCPRELLPDFIEARVAYYGLEPELERLFRDIRPPRREAA